LPTAKASRPKYSAYGDNISLPLDWAAGPDGTKSYALVMEDPDAPVKPLPVVHWLLWNIPPKVRRLDEHLPATLELASPSGARQGKNVKGKAGYLGPKPPEGNLPHHYNVQIFALDCVLDLPAGSDRHQFLAACDGHVLASGVLVGKFAWPVESAP
jgi:Raf kinase inhibitor-like YbhB/YbcL family protein